MKLKEEVEEIEREVYDYSLFLVVASLLLVVFGFAYYIINNSRSFVKEAQRSAYKKSRKQ